MKFMLKAIIAITCALATTASSSPIPDFPFISVSGSASRKVTPNQATISVTVLSHSKESDAAVKEVSATLRILIASLADLGVTEKDITGHDLEKEAIREKAENYKLLNILGYDVSRDIEIKLGDLKLYPDLIRRITSTNNVTSVSSIFDVDNRLSIQETLVAEACKDAKARADLMAKGVGASISGVFAVSDIGLYNVGERFGFGFSSPTLAGDSPGGEPAPVFAPATIEINSHINVLYRLAETKDR